jgi:hypothetical protein
LDVLLALVDHADRTLSKDELMALAWPGRVVEENNLTVQISALRKVLGPHAMVTLPGRGYRFSAFTAPQTARGVARTWNDAALPLVGREHEMAMVAGLLRERRLVTITGAAGVGSASREAREVAGFHGMRALCDFCAERETGRDWRNAACGVGRGDGVALDDRGRADMAGMPVCR